MNEIGLESRVTRLENQIAAALERIERRLDKEIGDLKDEQISDLREANRRMADDQRRLWEAVRLLEQRDNQRIGGNRALSGITHFLSAIFGGLVTAVGAWFSAGQGEVLDDKGNVVGKVIGDKKIAIDRIAVLPDLVKQDEPRLCPKAEPDREGSDQGKEYPENRPRQYEDFVKRILNPPPEGPTPSGFVYFLPRAKGDPVSFDDCELRSGRIVFEVKGENNAKMLTNRYDGIRENAADKILKQSARQIEASGGRAMVWVFAEEEAAEEARRLFDTVGEGRQYIIVVHIPWVKRNP